MHFFTTLVSGAAFVATALAQINIAFTSVPAAVVVGQEYNITWGGGNSAAPVTITLRKGDPLDLQTISTLTSTATDGTFLWTPEESLRSGEDYALQITQGQSDINYSGPFAVIGGTGSSSISYSGTSSLASATSTEPSSNSTITSMAGSSMGTGMPMTRNSTFSSQTLTGNSTSNSTTTTGTSISTSSSSSSRSTSQSSTGSESSDTAQETGAPESGAARFASSIALVFGMVAAIVMLN